MLHLSWYFLISTGLKYDTINLFLFWLLLVFEFHSRGSLSQRPNYIINASWRAPVRGFIKESWPESSGYSRGWICNKYDHTISLQTKRISLWTTYLFSLIVLKINFQSQSLVFRGWFGSINAKEKLENSYFNKFLKHF